MSHVSHWQSWQWAAHNRTRILTESNMSCGVKNPDLHVGPLGLHLTPLNCVTGHKPPLWGSGSPSPYRDATFPPSLTRLMETLRQEHHERPKVLLNEEALLGKLESSS